MKFARNIYTALFVIFLIIGWVLIRPSLENIFATKVNRPGWQIIRPPHEISALAIHGDIVFAGGQEGVFKIDRVTGKLIEQFNPGFPLENVRALIIDHANIIWIGNDTGLIRFDGKKWDTYTISDGLPDNRVNALFEDSQDRLWVGTWGGAAYWDSGKWNILTDNDGLLHNMVNVIYQDHQGGMWFGSYVAPKGGISHYYNGVWQTFTTENGLPHNNVTTIIEDNNEFIWAGTGLLDRGGACKFALSGTAWKIIGVITKADGLAGEKVRSIFQDQNGILWFGSEYDGFSRFNGENWFYYRRENGLSFNEVKTIDQDSEGNIWLGTADGITKVSFSEFLSMP